MTTRNKDQSFYFSSPPPPPSPLQQRQSPNPAADRTFTSGTRLSPSTALVLPQVGASVKNNNNNNNYNAMPSSSRRNRSSGSSNSAPGQGARPQEDKHRSCEDEELHGVLRQFRKLVSKGVPNLVEWLETNLDRLFRTELGKSQKGLDLAVLTGICEQCGKIGLLEPVVDICEYASSRLSQSTPRVAVQMLWSLVKVGRSDIIFLDAFTDYLYANLSRFVSQDISRTVWALAKIEWHKRVDFGEICDLILSCADFYNTQDLSMTVWGLSRLEKYIMGSDRTKMEFVFQKCGYVAVMHAQGGRLSPQDVSSITKSYARVQVRHQTLLETNALLVTQSIQSFPAEDLASVAWAFCKLNYKTFTLTLAIAKRATQIIESFSPGQLSTTVWALSLMWDWRFPGECRELMEEVGKYVKSKNFRFSAQDISTLLSGYARLKICDCCAIDALSDRAQVISSTSGFSELDCSLILSGLAQLGHVQSSSVQNLLESVCGFLAASVDTLSPQVVSVSLWSCVRLKRDFASLALFCLARLSSVCHDMPTHCLSNAVWAAAAMKNSCESEGLSLMSSRSCTSSGSSECSSPRPLSREREKELWFSLADCCVKQVTEFCCHDYANVLTAFAKKSREFPELKGPFMRIAAMLFVLRVDTRMCECGEISQYDLCRLKWAFRETDAPSMPLWFDTVRSSVNDSTLLVLDGVNELEPQPCMGTCSHKYRDGGLLSLPDYPPTRNLKGGFSTSSSPASSVFLSSASSTPSVTSSGVAAQLGISTSPSTTPSNSALNHSNLFFGGGASLRNAGAVSPGSGEMSLLEQMMATDRCLSGISDWQRAFDIAQMTAGAPGFCAGTAPTSLGAYAESIGVPVKNTFINFEEQTNNILESLGRPRSI